ncbi:isochorismate synthase MenF [Streptomyces sp. NPDC001404]|uniref:isochorismate synthase n=1 Tax=Streptomyces sp. NPDC001404 TaxID=3364571 RepID=UPI00368A0F07
MPPMPTASWLLATPRAVLYAEQRRPLPLAAEPRPGPGQFARAARTAEEALRHAPAGCAVVGALPFDERTAAILALARPRCRPRPPAGRHAPGPAAVDLRGDPGYLEAVGAAIDACRARTVQKVVLARSLLIPGPTPDDAPALLDRLLRQQPDAYVFCVDVGNLRLLIGASPELLLSRTGNRLLLNPLAGSARRHADPAEDAAAARALLGSPKDRCEHGIVVTELGRQLEPLCTELHIPARPLLKATGQLWHLSTTIRARLRHPAPSALALAALLHPTPAVCGAPREAARRLIEALESGPRGYYTGLVGWMDRHGDGQWVIALRCGELSPQGLLLHAGAGILAASDPEAELAETDVKLSTLLGVLALR